MKLADSPTLLGVDFTSTPSRRKPITVARGRWVSGHLLLEGCDSLPDWPGFEALLAAPGPWLGGFDFPFGLPRELVDVLGWPGAARGVTPDAASLAQAWAPMIRHLQAMTRAELRTVFKAWCDARPVGRKFAHRLVDPIAGASPSMRWVNPPVAYMLHEGAPRLLMAGVSLPGQHWADPQRVALETYPGWLARLITPASYKADDKARQTPERRVERQRIVDALCSGAHPLQIRVAGDAALLQALIDEPMGDALDAVLCLVQAAWGWLRRPDGRLLAAPGAAPGYGHPAEVDPVEGWILSVPHGMPGATSGR